MESSSSLRTGRCGFTGNASDYRRESQAHRKKEIETVNPELRVDPVIDVTKALKKPKKALKKPIKSEKEGSKKKKRKKQLKVDPNWMEIMEHPECLAKKHKTKSYREF
jgi:hypothetical protein